MVELALAILGVILTLVFSTPVLAWLNRLYRNRSNRRLWSADLHVERGLILKKEHYAFEFWKQRIDIDAEGNANHTVDARIVNIGSGILSDLTFPVYCDASGVSESSVNPWARSGRFELKAVVEDWNPERARGRVHIFIHPFIPPGERRRLRWGYTLPFTFREGDEYYNWDIATPHYELSGRLNFDHSWIIAYARWKGEIAQSQQEPRIEGSHIDWLIRFPGTGRRITIEFGLSKRRRR